MITIEQAKENLLNEVETPSGKLKLYGLIIMPKYKGFKTGSFGLVFYIEGHQKIFWNIDCEIIKGE